VCLCGCGWYAVCAVCVVCAHWVWCVPCVCRLCACVVCALVCAPCVLVYLCCLASGRCVLRDGRGGARGGGEREGGVRFEVGAPHATGCQAQKPVITAGIALVHARFLVCYDRPRLSLSPIVAQVFGDYGVGPNHVLPTSRTARYSGGLSVFTFLRVRTYLRSGVHGEVLSEDAKAGLRAVIADTAALARCVSRAHVCALLAPLWCLPHTIHTEWVGFAFLVVRICMSEWVCWPCWASFMSEWVCWPCVTACGCGCEQAGGLGGPRPCRGEPAGQVVDCRSWCVSLKECEQ
jgi:hypothetical protein